MQTLYRKYRPQTFSELIGQAAVANVLTSALKNKTFAHAYIFSGTRGTGKTSTARIMARELAIAPEDVYEIDAASNRKIDDIREIRRQVGSLPYASDFKMYILDEAHMLTKEAWNALLKTLEEPPAHVLFILATTELHKIPETILSRAELVRFATPSADDIETVLSNVSTKEKATVSKESLRAIAERSGSFRDALGSLQQAISQTKDTEKSTADNLADTQASDLPQDFLKNVFQANWSGALSLLENFRNAPEEQLRFFDSVIAIARDSLYQKITNVDQDQTLTQITSAHLQALLDQRIAVSRYPQAVYGLEMFVYQQSEKEQS